VTSCAAEFDLRRVPKRAARRSPGGDAQGGRWRGCSPNRRSCSSTQPFAGVDPIACTTCSGDHSRERGLGILITDHAVARRVGICDRAGARGGPEAFPSTRGRSPDRRCRSSRAPMIGDEDTRPLSRSLWINRAGRAPRSDRPRKGLVEGMNAGSASSERATRPAPLPAGELSPALRRHAASLNSVSSSSTSLPAPRAKTTPRQEEEVLAHGQLAKRGLLRQVADPHPRPLVQGSPTDFAVSQLDRAGVGHQQAHHAMKLVVLPAPFGRATRPPRPARRRTRRRRRAAAAEALAQALGGARSWRAPFALCASGRSRLEPVRRALLGVEAQIDAIPAEHVTLTRRAWDLPAAPACGLRVVVAVSPWAASPWRTSTAAPEPSR